MYKWTSLHLYMGSILDSYVEYIQFFLSPLCFNINVYLNRVATLCFSAGQCGLNKLSFRLTENLVNFQVLQRIVSQNKFFTTFENHSFFTACLLHFLYPRDKTNTKIVFYCSL